MEYKKYQNHITSPNFPVDISHKRRRILVRSAETFVIYLIEYVAKVTIYHTLSGTHVKTNALCTLFARDLFMTNRKQYLFRSKWNFPSIQTSKQWRTNRRDVYRFLHSQAFHFFVLLCQYWSKILFLVNVELVSEIIQYHISWLRELFSIKKISAPEDDDFFRIILKLFFQHTILHHLHGYTGGLI